MLLYATVGVSTSHGYLHADGDNRYRRDGDKNRYHHDDGERQCLHDAHERGLARGEQEYAQERV